MMPPNEHQRSMRLLTFNRFPENSATDHTSASQRFASQCAIFQNHYLQRADWTAQERRRLAKLQEGINLFSHIDFTLPPDSSSTQQYASTVTKELNRVQSLAFAWLQVDLPDDASEATIAFGAIVEAIQSYPQNEVVVWFLTTNQGTDRLLPEPFTTQLSENTVRVPLWMSIPRQQECAIQTITGTDDIVATIHDHLDNHTHPTATKNSGSLDLIETARSPGQHADRILILEGQGFKAARTHDFLYVNTHQGAMNDAPHDSSYALYAKPEDVWNLHDVSGEYHEVVGRLSQALRNHA